jgi:hypothetical protein
MQLLVLALDAALYPTLLAAVVILLAQPRPVALLGAYLAGGMLVSIAAGLAIVLVLGGSSSLHATSGLSWSADLAVGGLALLAAVALATRADERMRRRVAARRARRAAAHPPAQEAEPEEQEHEPWSQRLLAGGSIPLVFLAALAINLPGAAYLIALKDIAAGHHSTGADVALILVFNVIMFALAEIPLAGLLVARERTDALVAHADAWASSHGREIAIGLSGFLGVFLVVRGIAHAT